MRRLWPTGRVGAHASRITRLTVAAVIAYVVAKSVYPDLTDLTGPLTALLVVQATLYRSLHSGVGRVAAVLTGVLVASVLSSWVGLTWWSLGLAIGASLVLATMMRLGDHLLETPISAMLVLGVTQHDVAAETRMANTLIGAAVGMVFNLAFPPPVPLHTAQSALRDVALDAAVTLRRAGRELAVGLDRRQIRDWLTDIHAVLPLVGGAEAAMAQAAESRRFNPRAYVTPDVTPALRSGLAALDRSVLAIRAMLMSFQEHAPEWEDPDDAYGQELRRAFAVVLTDMGDCLEAFGEYTIAVAEQRQDAAEKALAHTLEILRETRAILTELCLVDPAENTSAWLLHGSILAGVERVLVELDVEAQARRQDHESDPSGPGRLHPLRAGQIITRAWINLQAWSTRQRT